MDMRDQGRGEEGENRKCASRERIGLQCFIGLLLFFHNWSTLILIIPHIDRIVRNIVSGNNSDPKHAYVL